MGVDNNSKEKFTIEKDGTIKRPSLKIARNVLLAVFALITLLICGGLVYLIDKSIDRSNIVEIGKNLNIILPSGESFVMVYVKGGQFNMGIEDNARERDNPEHIVKLSDYYIGEAEVTQALWEELMDIELEFHRWEKDETNYPVYGVGYYQAEEFCAQLNSKFKDQLPKGYKFRLPTEAQWEYAARGGENGMKTKYAGSNYIVDVGWFRGNSSGKLHSVMKKEPNELGIYDMSGNASELCVDFYDSNYYKESPIINPKNLTSQRYGHVVRGGNINSEESDCRIFERDYVSYKNNRDNGFRVALVNE